METKTTFLKLSLLALFLFITSSVSAVTYYTCKNSPFTPATPALGVGVTVKNWTIKQGATDISGFPKTTALAPVTISTPGSYDVYITYESSDPTVCAPDASTITIVILDALVNFTIGTPSGATDSYCGNSTSHSVGVTTATVQPTLAGTSATDLEYEYTYTVTKNGSGVITNNYGTVNAATGAYTLTTQEVGTYVITATIKYKAKGAPATGVLLNTSGVCTATSTSVTVEVKAAPTAPTITVS